MKFSAMGTFLALMIIAYFSVTANAKTPDECRELCGNGGTECVSYGFGADKLTLPMRSLFHAAQGKSDGEVCGRATSIIGDRLANDGIECTAQEDAGDESYLKTVVPKEVRAGVVTDSNGKMNIIFDADRAIFNQLKSGDYFMGGDLQYISWGIDWDGSENVVWGTVDGSCFSAPLGRPQNTSISLSSKRDW